MQQTAQALSEVTQYTAMVLPPALELNRLRHIQLVPLTEGRALLVVVTDTGFARDAVIRVPELHARGRAGKALPPADGAAVRLPHGRRSAEQHPGRSWARSCASGKGVPLAGGGDDRAADGAGRAQRGALRRDEHAALSRSTATWPRRGAFLAAVEGRDALYGMLKRARQVEFCITIGAENELAPLQDCSVVTATYRVGELPVGSFGVIGPTRMNYGKVVSVLEYHAQEPRARC